MVNLRGGRKRQISFALKVKNIRALHTLAKFASGQSYMVAIFCLEKGM